MSNYTVYDVNCETGETIEIVMDRLEYLIYTLRLPEGTTIEEAEAAAVNDELLRLVEPAE